MARPRVVDAPPGTGPLTVRLVVAHAAGMWRARGARIAGAAFVFFVPPALLFVASELVRDAYDDSSGATRWALLAGVIAAATFARFLGTIFFAGFLDLSIGDDYFRGEARTLGGVLRDLPWAPLIAVDVVVNATALVGLALFVVPGIVVYTLWGLVGPVVVQERRGVRDALRRTAQISRPHWIMVLGLVVVPLGVEHAFAEYVRHLVVDGGILLVVGAEWLIAMTMLAAVGVAEVALATELMARTPPGGRVGPAPGSGAASTSRGVRPASGPTPRGAGG